MGYEVNIRVFQNYLILLKTYIKYISKIVSMLIVVKGHIDFVKIYHKYHISLVSIPLLNKYRFHILYNSVHKRWKLFKFWQFWNSYFLKSRRSKENNSRFFVFLSWKTQNPRSNKNVPGSRLYPFTCVPTCFIQQTDRK